jgi:dsRNA-specific ribonuclease
VNDELLSAFSDVYSMPPQLHYARSIRDEDRFTVEDRAQVFRAYVGALERDHGFQAVKDWVYELMEWDNMFVFFLIYYRMVWSP